MPPRVNEGDCHDAIARREVAEVRHELRNYTAVADIKAKNLSDLVDAKDATLTAALNEIKSLLKWAGSLLITLIIGVLAWSLVQQYNANEQQKKELENQISLLREQERTRMIAEENRRKLQQLPAGAAEPAVPPGR